MSALGTIYIYISNRNYEMTNFQDNVHYLTINVPVVFMARYVMVRHLGPKKSRFSGPTPSNAPSNDVAHLKTIRYKRHKNNRYIGNFMYTSVVV